MRWALLAVFVPCQLALVWLDLRLEPGIVAFELAATPARSAAIVDGWGPEGQRLALLSVAVDYPYLVAYGLGLALVARRFAPRLAVLPIAAAALDALENLCLLAVLRTGPAPLWTWGAAGLATVKFVLLGVVAAGLLRRLAVRAA